MARQAHSEEVEGAEVVLVLPGFHGSGPGHWQSHWERSVPGLRRVEQSSWDRPRLGDWAATLEEAVRAQRGGAVLVAHSLGCVLVAQWARCGSVGRVGAALLVAPPDLDRPARSPELKSFAPMPLDPLPFPAWVVGSVNDPHATPARTQLFARAWGAQFFDAGEAGHINVESGHGPWPQGLQLLDEIRRGAGRSAA